METNLVCEFLLNIYKSLEDLCKNVDKNILSLGVHSAMVNTYIAFNKMTECMNDKVAYCNIKVLFENAFKQFGKKTELEYIYLLGYKKEDVKKIFGISERTFFRKIKKQKKQLYFAIKCEQSDKQLFDLIKSSKALTIQFNEFIKQKSKEHTNDF